MSTGTGTVEIAWAAATLVTCPLCGASLLCTTTIRRVEQLGAVTYDAELDPTALERHVEQRHNV